MWVPLFIVDVHPWKLLKNFLFSFDLIFRYLRHLGYKVRYVRNITDAGHLEGDNDEGDDKFAKKAKVDIEWRRLEGYGDRAEVHHRIP
nr:hypothetical protein [Sphingobacterium sp. T2]